MIGAKGLVAETIENGHGKVRLGDSVWLAEGPDMQSGAPIAVVGVKGTVLIVEPAK
jgi:membrane protein implicated in regulation of membrane protease activity